MPNDVFNEGDVAQTLSTLSQASPGSVRLLPQQTLDGFAVNVVEVDGWTNRPAQRTIFYFDAQTSVLRGFDASSLDPSYPIPLWQVRLSSSQTMAAAAVPPGAFALGAPASATIHPLDLGGPAFASVASTMTATCHDAANPTLARSLTSPEDSPYHWRMHGRFFSGTAIHGLSCFTHRFTRVQPDPESQGRGDA
ncbi:MAG TPA: hypothetical protein VNL35_07785 [Chloroflexota bacterium]|nr:hypothetical protein [Chloroflexota bacterium]